MSRLGKGTSDAVFAFLKLIFHRGDKFCTIFAQIGELRCLIPSNV